MRIREPKGSWALYSVPSTARTLGPLMRLVSMDRASNLFRACFCHGDMSVQNAQEMQKT